MAIRREWGDIGTVAQLGVKAGQADAQRAAQEQGFQEAMQRQQIEAQMASQQLQLNQKNQELALQLQRDSMAQKAQVAAQQMLMEWDAQKMLLHQQNQFVMEENKWQLRAQYEAQQELNRVMEIDNKLQALQKSFEAGEIDEEQFYPIYNALQQQRYVGQILPRHAIPQDAQVATTGGRSPSGKSLPTSWVTPQKDGYSPLESSALPYISDIDVKQGPADDTYERKSMLRPSAQDAWKGFGHGWLERWNKPMVFHKIAVPTEDTVLKSYQSWREKMGYFGFDEIGRQQMDATWDNMIYEMGQARPALAQLWQSAEDKVRELRQMEEGRKPLTQDQAEALWQEASNLIYQQTGTAPSPEEINDVAKQIAHDRGFKF